MALRCIRDRKSKLRGKVGVGKEKRPSEDLTQGGAMPIIRVRYEVCTSILSIHTGSTIRSCHVTRIGEAEG